MVKLSRIILRDVPKKVISIDFVKIPIEGGFRGLKYVPPGPHYVTVENYEGKHVSFWCFLGGGDVIVKVFNQEENKFVDDVPESETQYKKLAKSMGMDDSLIEFPIDFIDIWSDLTYSLEQYGSFPELKAIDESLNFHQMINLIYKKNTKEILADFQYTFLKMYIGSKINLTDRDLVATKKWLDMIIIIYNADPEDINNYDTFFVQWSSVLIAQLSVIPTDTFKGSKGSSAFYDIVVDGAKIFVEKMINCDHDEVPEQGKYFGKYIEERKAGKS